MKYEIHLIIQKLQPLQIDQKLNLVPSPWGKDFDEFPTILNLHPARMASNSIFADYMPRLYQKGFWKEDQQ